MINWKAFYANGGYYGENDPGFYDDECDEEDESISEESYQEDEIYDE